MDKLNQYIASNVDATAVRISDVKPREGTVSFAAFYIGDTPAPMGSAGRKMPSYQIIVPIALDMLPPAPHVTTTDANGQSVAKPFYRPLTADGDSVVFDYGQSAASSSSSPPAPDSTGGDARRASTSPMWLPIERQGSRGFTLVSGKRERVGMWAPKDLPKRNTIVQVINFRVTAESFVNVDKLDADMYAEFNALSEETRIAIAFAPRTRHIQPVIPLVRMKAPDRGDFSFANRTILLHVNTNYTGRDPRTLTTLMLSDPEINYGPRAVDVAMRALPTQAADNFFTEAKPEASQPSETTLDMHVVAVQLRPELKEPEIYLVPNLRLFSDKLTSYPVMHPLVFAQCMRRHPISFYATCEIKLRETIENPLNMGHPSVREKYKDGAVVVAVKDVHFRVVEYMVRYGIPCSKAMLQERYGDAKSAYPYKQDDLADILRKFDKGSPGNTFERKKLVSKFAVGDDGIAGDFIAFDLQQTEFPDEDDYDFFALELVDVPDLAAPGPDRARITSTEVGDALIRRIARPAASITPAEVAEVGKKDAVHLPYFIPNMNPAHVKRRIPNMLFFAVRKSSVCGSKPIDATALHSPYPIPQHSPLPYDFAAAQLKYVENRVGTKRAPLRDPETGKDGGYIEKEKHQKTTGTALTASDASDEREEERLMAMADEDDDDEEEIDDGNGDDEDDDSMSGQEAAGDGRAPDVLA